jgi:hypothetical protein
MVLGWKGGENPVIKGILDKIASLESKVKRNTSGLNLKTFIKPVLAKIF